MTKETIKELVAGMSPAELKELCNALREDGRVQRIGRAFVNGIDTNTFVCQRCGTSVKTIAKHMKYCPDCANEINKQRAKDWRLSHKGACKEQARRYQEKKKREIINQLIGGV